MKERTLLLRYNLQFFGEDGPGGEKTEPATAKKLGDARKDGQVARSKEIVSSITLFTFFVLLKVWTSVLSDQMLGLFSMAYKQIPDVVTMLEGVQPLLSFVGIFKEFIIELIIMVIPFFLISVFIAFVATLLQVKWVISTKPMQPKFSKLNPISGVKRFFSIQSLVELLKSLLKIAIMAIILYNELKDQWHLLYVLYDIPMMQAVLLAGNLMITIGFKISAFFLIVAAADYIFQKWKFNKDMKMTKQEVKDEMKNSEGDPQIKGKIRRKMLEASQRRMMDNLPKADVVITNPTHYAVAIQYDKDIADAPIVIAKGADYIAQKIKDAAREHGIEIVENKPLARSLYANVEIGAQVPPELYVAVAEVLAAVYRAQGKI